MKRFSSQYVLTKDKKLEITEGEKTFRSAIPLRYHLNPLQWLKNILLTLVKSKKRMRPYSALDMKDKKRKKLYLMHHEIQQVWNHPIKEKQTVKTTKAVKSVKRKTR
jgi:hypothetical protein